jgi:hypothetical protein
MNYSYPRAKQAATGVIAAMQTGAWMTKPMIAKRFVDAGYCARIAANYADDMVAKNTDIQHFSRWEQRGEAFGYGYGI